MLCGPHCRLYLKAGTHSCCPASASTAFSATGSMLTMIPSPSFAGACGDLEMCPDAQSVADVGGIDERDLDIALVAGEGVLTIQ